MYKVYKGVGQGCYLGNAWMYWVWWNISFSLKYYMSSLYVSGVVQFSLMTLFAKPFVQYCSSSAMSRIRFIISPYLMTQWTKMGGGLWFCGGRWFTSVSSWFVSCESNSYRLRVSVVVSGVLIRVRWTFFIGAPYNLPLFVAIVVSVYFVLARGCKSMLTLSIGGVHGGCGRFRWHGVKNILKKSLFLLLFCNLQNERNFIFQNVVNYIGYFLYLA